MKTLDGLECHKSDTPEMVCFYEQDFYVLSNFSAFTIMWEWTPRVGLVRFDTSEAVYHFMKFKVNVPTAQQFQLMERIRHAPSAHEAFKLAERNKSLRRSDWDDVKVDIMRDILRAKVAQHEYVHRKLLATGDRELVEDSWRDDFWGWGPNRDGKNMLGKLWMEIRAELRGGANGGKLAEAING
ncbi:NADAR family protein [Mesorhizobium sp.]|uniref:NADAR family protein n=1 Tax=Mesorhizobium sp. TaxID=1871066 RepID=UPI000FE599A2|nr:NADAR family protein [Mesorhizobium sp.]RWO90880.1 MAG: NADAR family protein [Mesorhizobium sp.]